MPDAPRASGIDGDAAGIVGSQPALGAKSATSPAEQELEAAALLLLLHEAEQQTGTSRRGAQQSPLWLLLSRSDSAMALLTASANRPPTLLQEQELENCLSAVREWRRAGIRLLGIHQSEYPRQLRDLADPPPVLFARGRPLTIAPTPVAVIGSRAASGTGLRAAASLARELAASGRTVVSGLAAGIDAAAHSEALRHGGYTVAVVGTGLRHTYPPQHFELQESIAQRGTLVSQFLPDTPPSRLTFPKRNAVMSGISTATVIVEASARSGARIQARHALQQGRPLFLHRLVLSNEWAKQLLGRPGVHAFAEPAQVIAELSK